MGVGNKHGSSIARLGGRQNIYPTKAFDELSSERRRTLRRSPTVTRTSRGGGGRWSMRYEHIRRTSGPPPPAHIGPSVRAPAPLLRNYRTYDLGPACLAAEPGAAPGGAGRPPPSDRRRHQRNRLHRSPAPGLRTVAHTLSVSDYRWIPSRWRRRQWLGTLQSDGHKVHTTIQPTIITLLPYHNSR